MKPQMSTANPLPAPRRRKRRSTGGKGLGSAVGWLILILLSPFLLLLESLRLGPTNRHTIYAFMLFTTVVMVITGLAMVVTEGPTQRMLKILNATEDYGRVEEVPHDAALNTIHQSAMKYNLDPYLIMAVIKTESDFNPDALSHKGARGLMQLMPVVWRHYQPDSRCSGNHPPTLPCPDGDCIFAPTKNIDTGAHYLHDLIQRFDGRVDLALEAYNAGLTNVTPDRPPRFAETRTYLQRVSTAWSEFRRTPTLTQIQLVTNLRKNLHWLWMLCGILWMVLFFWVGRRVLTKA